MLKHLASGGMADVLLGRSDGLEGFERHVVLKRIRPELARDQRFIRMFLDEARVAATLHHQHIVQVHDIGEADGEYFIAMEYVHGEDVRKILSSASRHRSHVPLGYAVAIVSAAAAGLHYAHERTGSNKQPLHIVHRDVSPSNILVGYDGSIKVVDFGIATASMQQETRSGSLKGKLSYMSPEQCKGAVLDRRSDVYALGVVLYELATTTRMIKGDNDYLVMQQIVSGRIAPPRARRPDLPKELSEIILRAIAPDRERRFGSADELRRALDQFASNAGLVASTSVIAAYMGQQFGQRPEPWLELDGAAHDVEPEVEISLDAAMSNSWSEMPPSEGEPGRTSSIPLQSGPLEVFGGELAPEPAVPVSGTAPTDSRMGWERQPSSAPRRFRVPREAVIGGVMVVGAAVWFASGLFGREAPASAPAAPLVVMLPAAAPAATAPAPLPSVAPAPPPADEAVPATHHIAEPGATRKARAAQAPPAVRTTSRAPAEVAPSPRPERPTRLAMSTLPARGDTGAADGESHRAVSAPPPPPPPQDVQPLPAPVVAAAPPPPAPIAPQVVAPAALEANRTAGDRIIVPDQMTMDAIGRSGDTTLVSSYKVCITPEGTVSSVSALKSTGFAAYDMKIQSAIRKEWRYRPFLLAGKPAAVCTALRFVYSQK
jgi:serine/threonine-protein kinase